MSESTEIAIVDRKKFVGGSDIAAILGLSPWKTPVELWHEKRKPSTGEEYKGKKAGIFKRGKRWESVVAEMLVERLQEDGHTVEIVAANKRYIDQALDFMACEIDFELHLDGETEITNCELKTVHPFASKAWGESESDQMPVYYTAQGMHGLGITGRNKCIMAPLFGADEIRTYTIVRDQDTIDWMRAEAAKFWELVVTGVAPAPILLRDMDVLHPTDSDAPALIADEELTRHLLRMRAIDKEIKARTAEYEALEFDVKRAMGDCTSLVVGSETKEAITWKERAFSFLDQQGLKADHPKLVKEYTKKGASRVFTLKSFSIDGVIP